MADHLSAGRQIEGYEIRRLLRRGGGIAGYEARVVGSGGAVIVNEYLPDRLAVRSGELELSARTSGEQSAFDAGLARFLALYQVLARISHPAVVAVDRVFRANGTGYAVMDYTQGETLLAMLADGATLSPQALSGILFPLVDGLEAVHRANLVHRGDQPGQHSCSTRWFSGSNGFRCGACDRRRASSGVSATRPLMRRAGRSPVTRRWSNIRTGGGKAHGPTSMRWVRWRTAA